MISKARILIVDDEVGILHGLRRFFENEGFQVETADTTAAAIALACKARVDLALVDIRLKGGDSGMKLLSWFRTEDADVPVIMVTGYGSIESAVDAMKHGAAEYVLKPVDNETLLEIVNRNLELARLRKDNTFLKKELLNTVYGHEIITQAPEMLQIIAQLDSVKNSTATILLSGESGTGKEVLARYIHFTGNRRDGSFVSINCAALSEDLLLSELFGHEKGAFTGAVERKLGKFELADKGTLFLDEIGDMSPGIQAKLLRVLEENSFERVGGTRRITVDIHVIVATNQDLRELINSRKFRNDLFYRISTVEIRLPPLRERQCDIPLLAEYFMRSYSSQYKKGIKGIRPELMKQWQAYEWPGNIRELQNTVHQAVLMCKGEELGLCGPGDEAGRSQSPAEVPGRQQDAFCPEHYATLKELSAGALSYYEKQRIREALADSKGNKSKAARDLAITRKTLLRKIKDYGIGARG